jgi:hypothetical protein
LRLSAPLFAALFGALGGFLAAACTSPAGEDPECTDHADCEAGGFCAGGVCHACDENLPAPNDPCLPKCGNSLGVGQPCTAGGGECTGNDVHALFCTIDQVPDAELHMCTGPCIANEDCGDDAVCQGDPDDPDGPKGCVPLACATE